MRCVSTCSARRRAGFMSSGPATAALSYALLIACASMPLLLPVSHFAVKLHERRQFTHSRKTDSEADGVEMEFRDAFKDSRGKRAAREKIDAIPPQRHASQAADELSKACIVQVGAYVRRASGRGARCSLRACAHHAHVLEVVARACRRHERRAGAIRDRSQAIAFAGD